MVVIIGDKSELSSTAPSSLAAERRAEDTENESVVTESDPPPYELPISSGSRPTPLEDLSDRKPTNYLEIYNYCAPISGKWKIDTALQVPSRPSTISIKQRPNVSLKTNVGTISATIELVGGSDRASIIANTHLGTLSMRVSNPNAQKIDLHCQTSTGAITIYLPRSFRGPFTLKTDVGTRTLSRALQRNSSMFSTRMGADRGFIGDLEGSGYGEDSGSSWTGDQLFVQASIGTIELFYRDEWKKGREKRSRSKSPRGITMPPM